MATGSTTISEHVFGGRRTRKRNADWGIEPGSTYKPYICQSPSGTRVLCTTAERAFHVLWTPLMNKYMPKAPFGTPPRLHKSCSWSSFAAARAEPHHPSGTHGCRGEHASPSAQQEPGGTSQNHRIINHLMMFKDTKQSNASLPVPSWGGAEEKI